MKCSSTKDMLHIIP